MDARRFSAHLVVLCSLASVLLTGAAARALAQNAGPVDSTSRLSETIYEEETVGLTMNLPEGVRVTRNEQSAQRVLVETMDMSWVGTLEVILTKSDAETITTVADRAIEASQGSTESEKKRTKECKVRSRETIDIGGQSAEQFVLDMAFDTRDGLMREVRIYTIFKPLPGTFVVYGVRGDGGKADEIVKTTMASVNTFRFRDPAAVARELQEGIDATTKVLSGLTEADYRRILVPDSWYRVYTKGDGLDNEVAYYRMREDIGPRGLVGAIRNPAQFSAAEAEEGLLVGQTARFLVAAQDQADGIVTEVESLAWMSFDRKREVWSTRQVTYEKVPRGYRVATRSSISGSREGGRIDVAVNVDGVGVSNHNFTVPDAYLSQAEQHLIYRLLNPGHEGTYLMYLFRPQTSDVKRRSEIIKATSDPDRFTVESRQDPSQPATTKIISAKGEIIRMEIPSGQITEPSDPAVLQKLWRAKGLPTGAINAIPDPLPPSAPTR